MRNKNRKKAQKIINKCVRAFNKNLLEDSLWRGRFFVHQVKSEWREFNDKSGGILWCWIEIRDKKTGLYQGFAIDNYNTEWKLWISGNDFIVERSGVWQDINLVKNDTTDWTKVKWNPVKEVY